MAKDKATTGPEEPIDTPVDPAAGEEQGETTPTPPPDPAPAVSDGLIPYVAPEGMTEIAFEGVNYAVADGVVRMPAAAVHAVATFGVKPQ